ncbi:MAG: FkbM family methyltransferase [Candidatus Hodarchaeota archaeon]
MAVYPSRNSITRKKLGKGVKVKTLTLASILQDRYADLVKVDVEGAEWLVTYTS